MSEVPLYTGEAGFPVALACEIRSNRPFKSTDDGFFESKSVDAIDLNSVVFVGKSVGKNTHISSA